MVVEADFNKLLSIQGSYTYPDKEATHGAHVALNRRWCCQGSFMAVKVDYHVMDLPVLPSHELLGTLDDWFTL